MEVGITFFSVTWLNKYSYASFFVFLSSSIFSIVKALFPFLPGQIFTHSLHPVQSGKLIPIANFKFSPLIFASIKSSFNDNGAFSTSSSFNKNGLITA